MMGLSRGYEGKTICGANNGTHYHRTPRKREREKYGRSSRRKGKELNSRKDAEETKGRERTDGERGGHGL